MRLIAWSSDVVSSDLEAEADQDLVGAGDAGQEVLPGTVVALTRGQDGRDDDVARVDEGAGEALGELGGVGVGAVDERGTEGRGPAARSEEHTSELQSLMRISYAVFCLTQTSNPYAQTMQYNL